jgi:hypothetical protein
MAIHLQRALSFTQAQEEAAITTTVRVIKRTFHDLLVVGQRVAAIVLPAAVADQPAVVTVLRVVVALINPVVQVTAVAVQAEVDTNDLR